MMPRPKHLAALWRLAVLWCCLLFAPLSWAISEADLLTPEQAFKVSATRAGTTVTVHYQIAKGYYLYRDRLSFATTPPLALGKPVLPVGVHKKDPFFGDTVIYHDAAEVRLDLPAQAPVEVTLLATLQGCADAGICYPPMTVKLPLGAASAPAGFDWKSAVSPPAAADDAGLSLARLERAHWPWVLLTFFVAGLGLAFTACMYPMLPIISAIVAGQGALLSRQRGFWLSLTYVQGMAVSYTAVGVVAGLTGSLLSVWLQQPAVIAAAAALLVVFALAMFDVVHVQLPTRWQGALAAGGNRLSGGRLLSVFAMGAVASLIVGPCVAPPLALALGYIGASGDAVLGGAALYALALGLGTPLVVVGTLGGAILPRAGMWMKTVKSLFGVMMLGLAVYLVTPFVPAPWVLAAWGSLALGCAVFMGAFSALPRRVRGRDKVVHALALVLALIGGAQWWGALSGHVSPFMPLKGESAPARVAAASEKNAWHKVDSLAAFSQQLEAAKAANRPVILDFYADWCASCLEMERDTFPDAAVQRRLADFVLLKADVTANTPEHQALLRHFGLYGPPGLLVFGRDGREQQRVIGWQSPQDLIKTLASVGV